MATIVHMIPNKLYQRLLDEGILDNEFPSEKSTPNQLVVEKFPITLQEQANAIITPLTKSGVFSRNLIGEIQYNNVSYPDSNIFDLLSTLVYDSSKLYQLKGADIFLKALQSEKVTKHLYNTPKDPSELKENGKIEKNKSVIIEKNKSAQCKWVSFEKKFKF